MLALRLKDWVPAQIEKLPERIRKDVAEILLDLRDDPYPPDSLAMFDEYDGYHRIRVDGFRIVYKVDENTVTIWKIAPRDRDTYTRLVP